jgi:hypothetical protein
MKQRSRCSWLIQVSFHGPKRKTSTCSPIFLTLTLGIARNLVSHSAIGLSMCFTSFSCLVFVFYIVCSGLFKNQSTVGILNSVGGQRYSAPIPNNPTETVHKIYHKKSLFFLINKLKKIKGSRQKKGPEIEYPRPQF